MTDQEAAREAGRRWGRSGAAVTRYEPRPGEGRLVVGILDQLGRMTVYGEGDTWEAAFEQAAFRGAELDAAKATIKELRGREKTLIDICHKVDGLLRLTEQMEMGDRGSFAVKDVPVRPAPDVKGALEALAEVRLWSYPVEP